VRLDASVTRKFAASIGELNAQIRQVLRGRSQCDYQIRYEPDRRRPIAFAQNLALEAKDYFSSGPTFAFHPYEGVAPWYGRS
jgi:hypothetical protein